MKIDNSSDENEPRWPSGIKLLTTSNISLIARLPSLPLALSPDPSVGMPARFLTLTSILSLNQILQLSWLVRKERWEREEER